MFNVVTDSFVPGGILDPYDSVLFCFSKQLRSKSQTSALCCTTEAKQQGETNTVQSDDAFCCCSSHLFSASTIQLNGSHAKF